MNVMRIKVVLWSSAATFVIIGVALGEPIASITTQTTSHGGYTTLDLTSVTLVRGVYGLQTVDAADLTNIDVFHYNWPDFSYLLQADTGPNPPTGTRAALLEDLSLDTGLMFTPGGTGLSAPPISTDVGIGVNFDEDVYNGPGPDVVLFASEDPDLGRRYPVVSPLDLGVPGRVSLTRGAGQGWAQVGSGMDMDMYKVGTASGVDTLSELESQSTAKHADRNYVLYGAALDLSNLGYAEGEFASGLFFQSSGTGPGARWGPHMIVGLHRVPEPSSVVVFFTGAVALAGIQLVRRRRKRN